MVLTPNGIQLLLDQLSGARELMASLLYRSGLRRIELLRLRLKDVDFDHLQLRIWIGKGAKHRLTTLTEELVEPLKHHMALVVTQLEQDRLCAGFGGAWMPGALSRKYRNGAMEACWQYLFPASNLNYEPGGDRETGDEP